MNKEKTWSDIIERIEYIRTYLGLNKSRFSGEIGLKPQTYNNFIGAQGSKPSVELVLGVANRFGVNPNWILNGKIPVFQEWTPEQDRGTGAAGNAWTGNVAEEGGAETLGTPHAQALKLARLEEAVNELTQRMDATEGGITPLAKELVGLLSQLRQGDPAAAETEIRSIRERLQKLVDSDG